MAIKILIEGWRGINHSYSLVNQFQIREFIKLGYIVHHSDVPFYKPTWELTTNNSGFPKTDQEQIMSLIPIDAGQADVIYRIAVPFRMAPIANKRVLVFGTSETQKIPEGVIQPSTIASVMDANLSIVTPSSWSKEGFVSYGFPSEKVIVVPHGVDMELYRPIEPDVRAEFRKTLGICDDDILFLNVGAMTPGKGIDLLLQSFVRLSKTYPRAKLLLKDQRNLYGIGAADVISKFIKSNSSNANLLSNSVLKKITIISQNLNLQQLAILCAASDCYISPYRAEGFNLPPLEAAACGVPIIVSAGGATDEYASSEFAIKVESRKCQTDTGNFLEPRADSLENAMEKILTGCFKVDISRTREQIKNRFTWEVVVKHLANKFFLA
jgi:glycosyltransferase involved in cell wall biosynthesis